MAEHKKRMKEILTPSFINQKNTYESANLNTVDVIALNVG